MASKRRHLTFQTELGLQHRRLKIIVGIDEAGMGPWAGPVVAAAVVMRAHSVPGGLADSKVLSAPQREHCFAAIMQCADVGIGVADVARVDADNVLRASQWAMAQAVGRLTSVPDLALVDGRYAPQLGCPSQACIDGDAKIASIAAASIIAKVTRDRLMSELAQVYPGYGFERHKGYGTPGHRAAIDKLGLTAIHRRSFKPIQMALARLSGQRLVPALTHDERRLE